MATSIFLSHPLSPFSPLSKHHKIPTAKQTSTISSYHFNKHILPNNPTTKTPFPSFPNSLFPFSSKPRKQFNPISVGRTQTDEKDEILVGEDSAEFELSKQKISSWVYFLGILGVVLYALNVIWIDNSTGFGKSFIDAVSTISDSHEVYFINHRYDGVQLWELKSMAGIHELVWFSNFISFFFLYPSTFNLLEVAAVDKPKMHLWETGIMRITRHPQMVGQVIWCLAHTLWIGNSVAMAASVGLIGHHLFGAWNGDRRLAIRYAEAFEAMKKRTSVIPFAAILDGRQKLPEDYYKEFIRLPYVSITALTLGAYFLHPIMQAASYRLHW
ncbi:15-cis-zeta-carotene isomerase, chloroplastic-like isoform X2 [Lycium ferocissimum]|uniref:15-cis-zeta-carotene isomerase, chloroplastic-like isoform X2 n=1 Tax=Lycium ferocissimum TaxID=112874 RepID=UPI002814D0CB|nr:15-cis-zeta-carotene isomerase, chloroplastic-like isoform X2 [Lycium ferocissimum]